MIWTLDHVRIYSYIYNNLDGQKWGYPDITFNLITYVIVKFFNIILSVSTPIPNGIFAPVFSLGGGVGRLYGHILRLIGDQIGVKLIRCKNYIHKYIN